MVQTLAKWGTQRPPLLTCYAFSIQASRDRKLLLIRLKKEGIPVVISLPLALNPHLYLFYIHLQWCEFSETPLLICLLFGWVFFLNLKLMTKELFIHRVYSII